jgi:amino acid transporter
MVQENRRNIMPDTPLMPKPNGLRRSMKVLGTLLITLSAVTPASSVFIIVPGIISTAGTGAFWSMLAGAFVGVCMALVYAELSSAYPLTGGEYAIVGRVLGPLPGFIVMGVILVTAILIPAVLALGVATYLDAVFPGFSAVPTAIGTILITTVIAMLHVRTNAVLTGIFLAIEIAALLVLVGLGFANAARPLSDLFVHPVVLSGSALIPASAAKIGMATSVAIFAYNGYGAAVYFGEETHDARRHIARAILWALALTVAAELVPTTAVLLGAPDLVKLLGASNMMGEFIASRGSNAVNIAVSLGVALAIFNAVIAIMLQVARLAFSTGRDIIWPHPISTRLTYTHARFNSPWLATLACGALASLACLINENTLFVITGTGLVMVYGMLCVAAIIGRRNGTTAHAEYKMPLFPTAPVVALLVMLYVIYTNWLDPVIGRPSLLTTAAICLVSLLYYVLVLRRRGEWVLRGPEE